MKFSHYRLAFILGLLCGLTGLGTVSAVWAQGSNQLWLAICNGNPTPSSDVAICRLTTDGSAVTGNITGVGRFLTQTDFSAFATPYDLVVDPAMGKMYVLDNNLTGKTPEYIYSFNLAGTPAQVAASVQKIYTMPVPAADITAGLYPRISGITLDTASHYLYFLQFDQVTSSNAYVGRMSLAASGLSNVNAAGSNLPPVLALYSGNIPGQGTIALDTSNLYVGVYNMAVGNAGVYAAPNNGSGSFTELVVQSAGDTSFANGMVSGVASDAADHLIYYLTFDALYGAVGLNALWVYNMNTGTTRKIGSGYPGIPDNLAIDTVNRRYYFTCGWDGTGNIISTNYQSVYTGVLGATNAPTLFYTPSLTGQDAAGQLNAGKVILAGIYVENAPTITPNSSMTIYPRLGVPTPVLPLLTLADVSSTLLTGATVAITGGQFFGDGDILSVVTNGTSITANYNPLTEILTLRGCTTLANYQQVLRSVAYISTNSNPTEGGAASIRTMLWGVTDGELSTATTNSLQISLAERPSTNKVSLAASTSHWQILFNGAAGQQYVVQTAASLQGPWTSLSPVLTADGNGLILYQDVGLTATNRFYRVRYSQ